MNDNDNALGGFLGLVTLGAVFLLGRKTGSNKMLKQINDQQRDNEIADLKRQIQVLLDKKNER